MGFRAEALQHPDKPAIVMPDNGVTVSFGELSDRADQYANLFRQQGLQAGDSIAFTLDNCPEYFATCFGAFLQSCVRNLSTSSKHCPGMQPASHTSDY